MFKVDDVVRYGTNGVCRITDITVRSFCGEEMEYYVLRPVASVDSTYYVPVYNEQLVSRMQYILSSDEIHALIGNIGEYNVQWIENDKERLSAYSGILASGDRRGIIGVVRTLYRHREELIQNKKKMHLADEKLMQDAERMINDEFSAVLGIAPSEVPEFISKELQRVK